MENISMSPSSKKDLLNFIKANIINEYYTIIAKHSNNGHKVYNAIKKDKDSYITKVAKNITTKPVIKEIKTSDPDVINIVNFMDSFMHEGAPDTMFYFGDYEKNVNNMLKLFPFTFSVIKNTSDYNFFKIKNTLLKDGLLNNITANKFKIIVSSTNVENHTRFNQIKKIQFSDLKEDEIITVKFVLENNTILPGKRLYFNTKDCDIKYPSFVGYNLPKDRTIVPECTCRVIKEDFRYSNFTIDEEVNVITIYENKKTAQRTSALVSSVENPNKTGIVLLLQLKRK
jgi:hypothetical protein